MAARPLLNKIRAWSESLAHSGTVMAYPTADSLPPLYLSRARQELASIAATISRFEPVTILSRPELAPSLLSHPHIQHAGPRLSIYECKVDQCWIRDSGCFFVQEHSAPRAVDLNFNNWGEKHPVPPHSDRTLAARLSELLAIPRLPSPLTTEGGALETDGAGTLLATESSIVNDNRNPGRTKAAVGELLKRTLGVRKVIWLKGVKGQDTTDCHVDALARFALDRSANEGAERLVADVPVLLSRPHSSRPAAWMRVYEEARAVLEQERTADGRAIRVVDVPEPSIGGLMEHDEEDMVATYVNFAWVNGGIVMPSFGDRECDERAIQIFQAVFPGRIIAPVTINALPILGGGIHCVTLQVPSNGDQAGGIIDKSSSMSVASNPQLA
ncbi:predicted protein [Uncinocarpus reesii 1704]|uniref:Agmatine deiminase n=1 Tax=Uncinocarpus reesii (strain UAMH 1704) TaxID=336963 RepID=C4JTN2_UNCRE|nr:uncharacterized protein UREG_05821 [Uncinocarpus reesii 1704]EEP80979.1 predicted protein [Uncinocarpus reesii 1704]